MKRVGFLRIPSFLSSTVHNLNPEWHNDPVVVVNGNVIVDACPIARLFDVRTKDSYRHAKLCIPTARFIKAQDINAQPISNRIWDICSNYSPYVEPISISECFVDLSGLSDSGAIGTCIVDDVKARLNFDCRLCIAPTKLLSRLGCYSSTEPTASISEEQADGFLRSLPIGSLWTISEESLTRLYNLGFKNIGDIYGISMDELVRQFDTEGYTLFTICHGIDESPVIGLYPPPRIISGIKMDEPLEEFGSVMSIAEELCKSAIKELKARCMETNEISISLSMSMPVGPTGAARLMEMTDIGALSTYTSSEAKVQSKMRQKLRELFKGPVFELVIAFTSLKKESGLQMNLYREMNSRFKTPVIEDTVRSITSRFGLTALCLGYKCNYPRRDRLLRQFGFIDILATEL